MPGNLIGYVICSPVSYKTGHLLAETITRLQGRRCRYYNERRPRRNQLNQKHLRWGATWAINDELSYNKLPPVLLASDKLRALQVLDEAGVSTPAVFTPPFGGTCSVDRIFRKITHHAANDRPYLVSAGRWFDAGHRRYDYALEFIKARKEYRIHVFGDRTLRAQEKRYDGPPELMQEEIKCAHLGWVLHTIPRSSVPIGIRPLAVKSVQALGLDFGAVDIILGADGKAYVLEVNTAPGLNEPGAKRYAKAILRKEGWTDEEFEENLTSLG